MADTNVRFSSTKSLPSSNALPSGDTPLGGLPPLQDIAGPDTVDAAKTATNFAKLDFAVRAIASRVDDLMTAVRG